MADASTQSSPIAEVQREGIQPGESDKLRREDSTPGDQKQIEIVHSETRHHDRTLDIRAIWALAAQHFSRYGEDHLTLNKLTLFCSTWGDRCAEFAWYLYLIILFENTLLPASIFGFFTTGNANSII